MNTSSILSRQTKIRKIQQKITSVSTIQPFISPCLPSDMIIDQLHFKDPAFSINEQNFPSFYGIRNPHSDIQSRPLQISSAFVTGLEYCYHRLNYPQLMELNWDWLGYPKRMKLSMIKSPVGDVVGVVTLLWVPVGKMVGEAVGGVDVVELDGLEGGAKSYIARQPLRDCHLPLRCAQHYCRQINQTLIIAPSAITQKTVDV